MISPEILKILEPVRDRIAEITRNRANEICLSCEASNLASISSRLFKELDCTLATVIATDERDKNGSFLLRYVYAHPSTDVFFIIQTKADQSFPSLSRTIPALNWYEREIRDLFGLIPQGHPDPRSLVLHPEAFPPDLHPLRKDVAWDARPEIQSYGDYEYKSVKGEGIYNILVGPIHAGIIEPGHFRFSLAGEPILRLEVRHFWKHRGIEKLAEGKGPRELLRLSDKISGDNAFAHTLAYAQAVEKLSGTQIPQRAESTRVIFAELERLMGNFNDFSGIFQDVGFGFGAQGLLALKEDLMRLNKEISGNRFNKGVIIIGGVQIDLDGEGRRTMKTRLEAIRKDYLQYKKLLFNSASVLERLEGTGKIRRETARDLSCTGPTARASGLPADLRKTHPYLNYDRLDIKGVVLEEGDVLARLQVRLDDIEDSLMLIGQCLEKMPGGAVSVTPEPVQPGAWALGYAEGQRGSIFHFVMTDDEGRIARWKIRDPSFANWQAIQFAALGDTIADFPLVNKSLSLSYAGNDL